MSWNQCVKINEFMFNTLCVLRNFKHVYEIKEPDSLTERVLQITATTMR